jgi:hypothetical protein
VVEVIVALPPAFILPIVAFFAVRLPPIETIPATVVPFRCELPEQLMFGIFTLPKLFFELPSNSEKFPLFILILKLIKNP